MSDSSDALPQAQFAPPEVDDTCDRLDAVARLMDADRAELAELGASLEQGFQSAIRKSFGEPDHLSVGDRLADKVAAFGGSWAFIVAFLVMMTFWILWNVKSSRSFDPYPFILLNLILSCIAALQAPIIMMSQNRQEAKDRLRAQHDFEVNVMAEMEIRRLHDKIDHLLYRQMQRLLEIQRIQTEMLREAGASGATSGKTGDIA